MGVAWFYYSYGEESTQAADALRLSLVQQLAQSSRRLYDSLKSAYKESNGNRPTSGRTILGVGELVAAYSKVFIVVDALDECPAKYRDGVLDMLSDFQGSGANILITSQHNIKENIARSTFALAPRITVVCGRSHE